MAEDESYEYEEPDAEDHMADDSLLFFEADQGTPRKRPPTSRPTTRHTWTSRKSVTGTRQPAFPPTRTFGRICRTAAKAGST